MSRTAFFDVRDRRGVCPVDRVRLNLDSPAITWRLYRSLRRKCPNTPVVIDRFCDLPCQLIPIVGSVGGVLVVPV